MNLVGPGTYNDNDAQSKLRNKACPVRLKPITALGKVDSNAYIFVGNSIVYEPRLMTATEKASKEHYNAANVSVDINSGLDDYFSFYNKRYKSFERIKNKKNFKKSRPKTASN